MGDPGLRARAAEASTWLEARCVSYGAEAPYGPFADVLRTWIGADEGDAELAVRTKLRARAGALLGAALDQLLPYLGLLLLVRLEPDQERELLAHSADELADRQRDAYLTWAEAVAAKRPLVVAIDDLHWANRTTRELADRLLDLTDRSAFILATALRPDPGSEAWAFRLRAQAEYPHRTEEVALAPLASDAARQLIDTFVPPGLLGDAVRDELVNKAEGNPLYVEELVRALRQSGGGDRRRTWTITPGAAADPIGDVGALLRAEIVRELRRFPELECTFRHGLLQEAAISTLTPTALRELNGRIGHAMEERFADQLDDRLEQLAFYFYRSDEPEIALGYLEWAAERAAGLEAFERATSLWTRARGSRSASRTTTPRSGRTSGWPSSRRGPRARVRRAGGRP